MAGRARPRAGRRIPGHQRHAVRGAEGACRRARALHSGGRRRPVDLRLARRDARQPEEAADRLPESQGHQARAELPQHQRDPARGQQRDRTEPQALSEDAVQRTRRGRAGARGRCRQRGARGRTHGGAHPEPARRRRHHARPAVQGVPRFRDPLPRQPPGPGVRAGLAQSADPLQGFGRPELLRPRRDQGPVRLVPALGQQRRRPGLPARRDHAQARHRPHHAGQPGHLREPVQAEPVRGPVLALAAERDAEARRKACTSSAATSTTSNTARAAPWAPRTRAASWPTG